MLPRMVAKDQQMKPMIVPMKTPVFKAAIQERVKGIRIKKNLDIKDKDKESKDKKDKNNDPQLEKSLKKETTKAIKKATQ
jgi:hypothetical protein